jgi:ankyrin repeat protein
VALIQAAKQRAADAVRELVRQGADANAAAPDGTTALHWAAHLSEIETAVMLIRAGAKVDAATDLGVTALSLACTNGDAAMVRALVEAGANANSVLPNGETVLMTCARTGNVELVKTLLQHGANVSARQRSHGQTALMWAAAQNHAAVVRVLSDNGADINARAPASGFTPLLFAARNGAAEAARALLDVGANVNDTAADGTAALLVAAFNGHWDLAQSLLEQGADPNAIGAGFTALHWAAGTWETDISGVSGPEGYQWIAGLVPGKLEFVKALLSRGADPNATITKAPPRFGIRAGSRFNLRGATPFLVAADGGNVPIMQALLAAGANPLMQTADQTTPLMAAAGLGQNVGESRVTYDEALAAVTLIVSLGGEVSAANDAGETALHGAAYFGADGVVEFLVSSGADVNATNRFGSRPLTIALGYGQGIAHESTATLLRKLGGVDEVEVEGPIMDVQAACPQAVFSIDNVVRSPTSRTSDKARVLTVQTSSRTAYASERCEDLKVGRSVRVTGRRIAANVGPIDASTIESK